MKQRNRILLSATLTAFAGAGPALAQGPLTPPAAAHGSVAPPSARRAYFGELHLHTTLSFDAWTFGTKTTPDQAYRFARGETVMIPAIQVARQQGVAASADVPARRAWPLDFAAVTDHSEQMGALAQLDAPGNALAKTPIGQKILADPGAAFFTIAHGRQPGKALPGGQGGEVRRHAWDLEQKAANDNYFPGRFTTFIAYEWSSRTTDRADPSHVLGTIHRNVIFKGDHAPLPFTSVDSDKPEDLWSYLEKTRAGGVDVIAIPHNGNLSGGTMYDWNDSAGRPIDEPYAQRRALNEPLTEIVQNKGQSETVPQLAPSDEFANFEIYDRLLASKDFTGKPDGSYVRQALGRGLVISEKVGANPFKFGVVGASDIHNGLSVSDEAGMASGPYGIDPRTMAPTGDTAKRALGVIKTPTPTDPDEKPAVGRNAYQDVLGFGSAGVTGVWAEENTRDSIFAALKRKETFATSGTRIRVRMFGGWRFGAGTLRRADWVAEAYGDGVPMGGDLPARPGAARAPAFVLEALKDPDGANLDRAQIIKIWIQGETYRERIYDVALSGGRKDSRPGHAPAVGNSVNLKTGAYANTIGAARLSTVWRDPAFDPGVPAVYYARVLEIPTPRWSTLLAIRNHLPIPKGPAATIQERAWTSPIWFTPARPLPVTPGASS